MSTRPNNLRILLYSHDTVGLGHTRRNQSIACGLARSLDEPVILMASGARESTLFDIPKCVDFVTLPAVRKSLNGEYKPRNSGLTIGDAMNMRTEILRSVIESFRPDVFVADKIPLGVHGELEPALRILREQTVARCVLGLRDILDEPEATRSDWRAHGYERAIRDYYDSVWVYGDRRVYDVAKEYGLSAQVANKMTYVGYLDRSTPADNCCGHSDSMPLELRHLSDRIALCMVGGGEDGALVASAFAKCRFPSGMSGVILTGPYMPAALRDYLHTVAATNRKLLVIDFMKRPEWLIAQADRVVAMGGYNTVCELLSYGKPALIIPRVTPRQEQLVRARRLHEMGLLEMMHPGNLTSESLSRWLSKEVQRPANVRDKIDLDGLQRLPRKVTELFEPSPSRHRDDQVRPVPCCIKPWQTSSEARL